MRAEVATRICEAMRQGGVNFVASLPENNLEPLIGLFREQADVIHVPLAREEEGIGICTGGALTGHRVAILMQNGGLLNSCNGLTTTALQFGMPLLLLIYYAGDWGDNAFHMLGLVTEPVLQALDIKYQALRDPETLGQQIRGAVTVAEASKRPVALLVTRAVL